MANGVGMRVVIGGWSENATSIDKQIGGHAFVGSFGDGSLGSSTTKGNEVAPAFVFSGSLDNDPKRIWEAVSHEVGHTLGLSHDGYDSKQYFGGFPEASWGPIMGSPYLVSLSQWSKGEYKGATNTTDDIAIISSHLPFVADDVGNTLATAQPIATPGSFSGLVGHGGDVDVFSITVPPGSPKRLNLSLALLPAYSNGTHTFPRSNLDAEVLLNDSAGALLETWSNTYGLFQGRFKSAPINKAGTYYISVRGTGQGDPATTGYSAYGSSGPYTLEVDTFDDTEEVVVFTDCWYQGASISLLARDGSTLPTGWDDAIRSVKLPMGVALTLYEDRFYGGKSVTLTDWAPCLDETAGGWGAKASSYKTMTDEDRRLAEYFGCFTKAAGNASSLVQVAPPDNQMTPTRCRELVLGQSGKDFKLYAILGGRTCFGGEEFGDRDSIAGACSLPCAGDTRLTCGGPSSFSVFKIPDVVREALGCFQNCFTKPSGGVTPGAAIAPAAEAEAASAAAGAGGAGAFCRTLLGTSPPSYATG